MIVNRLVEWFQFNYALWGQPLPSWNGGHRKIFSEHISNRLEPHVRHGLSLVECRFPPGEFTRRGSPSDFVVNFGIPFLHRRLHPSLIHVGVLLGGCFHSYQVCYIPFLVIHLIKIKCFGGTRFRQLVRGQVERQFQK
jgi:hypothetical protein